MHILKINLFLNNPCLSMYILDVFIDLIIWRAIIRITASFHAECHTARPHHALRPIEFQLLTLVVDEFGAHDHVARPWFEQLYRLLVRAKILLFAQVHVKFGFDGELIRVHFVPVYVLLDSCHIQVFFEAFLRLVNHLVGSSTNGQEKLRPHRRIFDVMNALTCWHIHL